MFVTKIYSITLSSDKLIEYQLSDKCIASKTGHTGTEILSHECAASHICHRFVELKVGHRNM